LKKWCCVVNRSKEKTRHDGWVGKGRRTNPLSTAKYTKPKQPKRERVSRKREVAGPERFETKN